MNKYNIGDMVYIPYYNSVGLISNIDIYDLKSIKGTFIKGIAYEIIWTNKDGRTEATQQDESSLDWWIGDAGTIYSKVKR